MKVLIAGGGIGGLTAALALAREGHQVSLAEKRPGFDPVGAGIIIAPNANRLLERLGVDLSGEGFGLGAMEITRADGRVLNRIDLGALRPHLGPAWALPRPALHHLLAAAVPGTVALHTHAEVTAVQADAAGVEVSAGPASGRYELLIGADGLHSQVRALTVGEVARRFTGTTCWRLVTQNPGVTSALEAWGGPARVGLVPLRGERVYAYLVLEAPARAGAPGFPQAFKARFGHFGGVVGRFIEALQEAPPLHHDLEELDAPAWGAGRVLLLGDAAHAMTPNQGQGAGMAIEDAVALAQALRPGADGALERYVALRHARVRRMQLDSRRIGRVAHWSNPAGTFVRDALLQLTPARTATAQYRRGVLPGLRLLER